MHVIIKLFEKREEYTMDWPKIISEILWMEEITEMQLANSLLMPVTNSCINRLKKGFTKMPSYALGDALIKRHKRLIRQHQAEHSSLINPL